jgi:hypothetical protein
MAGSSEYLAFGTGVGANVLDFATYSALAARSSGFATGVAQPDQVNTALRQASVGIAGLSKFIADTLNITLSDDGDVSNYETKLTAAINALISSGGSSAASASDIWTGTNNAKFVTAKALADAMADQALTDASTVAWNMANGFRAKVTLGGNRTLGQPTGLIKGMTGSLQVQQDGTGSRTLAYAACWDFMSDGAPSLSTGANKRDKIYFEVVDAVTPRIEASFRKSA